MANNHIGARVGHTGQYVAFSLFFAAQACVPGTPGMVDTSRQQRKNTAPRRHLTTQQRQQTQHLTIPEFRHGSNCSAISVTNWIVHRIIRSQFWVNIPFFTLSYVSILLFLLVQVIVEYYCLNLLIVYLTIASCCCWVLHR